MTPAMCAKPKDVAIRSTQRVANFVTVLIPDALVLFSVDLTGDDDFRAATLFSLYKFFQVLFFLSAKSALACSPPSSSGADLESCR